MREDQTPPLKITNLTANQILWIMGIVFAVIVLCLFLLSNILYPSKSQAPSTSKDSYSPTPKSTRTKSYPSGSELRDRETYIQSVENSFNENSDLDQQVHLTILGAHSDTLQVHGTFIESEFAEKFIKRSDIKRPLRQHGFDHVVITNGKRQWKYDLWDY